MRREAAFRKVPAKSRQERAVTRAGTRRTGKKNEVARPQSNFLQVCAPLSLAFLPNLQPFGGKLIFKAVPEAITEGKGREEWGNSFLMQSGVGTA